MFERITKYLFMCPLILVFVSVYTNFYCKSVYLHCYKCNKHFINRKKNAIKFFVTNLYFQNILLFLICLFKVSYNKTQGSNAHL